VHEQYVHEQPTYVEQQAQYTQVGFLSYAPPLHPRHISTA
jgi:hypothetical protein